MRVHADSAELKFYVVENLFEVLFACLLEEHLAQEVGEGVHHELVELIGFRQETLKHVLYELAVRAGPRVVEQLDFFSDLSLQNLTPKLVPREQETIVNQKFASIVLRRQQVKVLDGRR